MKKIVVSIGAVILFVCIGIGFGFYQTLQDAQNMEFHTPDVTIRKDGSYLGSCDATLVQVEIEVQIEIIRLAI